MEIKKAINKQTTNTTIRPKCQNETKSLQKIMESILC